MATTCNHRIPAIPGEIAAAQAGGIRKPPIQTGFIRKKTAQPSAPKRPINFSGLSVGTLSADQLLATFIVSAR